MKRYKENKIKVINILILLIIFPLNIFGQDVNYEGEWTVSGDSFENTLMLEKVNTNENLYKFSFVGWRKSYDTFTDQIIKFLGEMSEDRFVIQIRDNVGYYTDDTYVEDDDEFRLYNQGEERCKVLFEFDKESIRVNTTACRMIYAGFGVSFDGEYKKTKSNTKVQQRL